MGKWETVRLGDVCTLLNGRAYKQDELLREGKTPVLRVGNFFSNRDWYYSNLELDENKYCEHGDLLYAWSASFGPRIWDGSKAIYHYHIWKILLSERVQKQYMYYLLERITGAIKEGGRGITMIHATKSGMEQREIPLPPLSVQQKIADVLNRANILIEKRKAQMEKLDLLVKSRFVEMFGDPVTNPMGWETVELGKLTDVGSSKRIFANEYVDSGVPFFRTKEVVELSRGEEIETPLYISQERYDAIANEFGHPERGDLLISAVGTIGVIWVVDNDNPFYFKDGNLILVKKSEKIKSVIFKTILERLIKSLINDLSAGSAYSALTIVKLKQVQFPLPPLSLQTQFAAFVERVEAQKAQLKQGLELMELEYKSLMQKCFNGELY